MGIVERVLQLLGRRSVSGRGQRLSAGQLFHIQVILKEGTPDVAIAEDGWTTFSVDGRRGVIKSCMMEVERDGCRLLGRFLDEPAPSSTPLQG